MTLLVDSALRATVILVAGWLTVRLLASASADLRRVIWRIVIATVALMPALGLLAAASPRVTEELAVLAIPVATEAVAEAASSVPWMPIVWVVGCLAVLLRLGLGLFQVAHWSRKAGVDEGVRYSARVAMPMTWGFVRPVILLPAAARSWASDERELVVRHELAHVEHRDWAWQMLSQLVCAVFWFHPLVWVAHRGLCREAERAADDRVLGRGVDAPAYAAQLVKVARAASLASSTAVAMAQASTLEDRVRHVLRTGANRGPAQHRVVLAFVVVAVALGVSMASLRGQQVFQVNDPGISRPVLIKQVHPIYPADAKAEGVQGTVILQLQVSEEGVPEFVRVVRSVDDRLDRSAIDAVEQWRYAPARRDGEPVRVELTCTINYTLR
jgi:TonB family protein